MAVDAILVYGTRLYSCDTVDGSYTEYADMKSIGTLPAPDSPEVDVTPLADSDDFRQFRLGLAVAGQFDAEQFYTKTRMTTIQTQYRTKRFWRIVFPDGANVGASSKVEFQGWLKQYSPPAAANADDPAIIKFTVKLTGKPTFTAGS